MRRRLFFGAVALVASGWRKLFSQPIEPKYSIMFNQDQTGSRTITWPSNTTILFGKDLPNPLRQGVTYYVAVDKAGDFKIVTTPGGEQIEIVHEERTYG